MTRKFNDTELPIKFSVSSESIFDGTLILKSAWRFEVDDFGELCVNLNGRFSRDTLLDILAEFQRQIKAQG